MSRIVMFVMLTSSSKPPSTLSSANPLGLSLVIRGRHRIPRAGKLRQSFLLGVGKN